MAAPATVISNGGRGARAAAAKERERAGNGGGGEGAVGRGVHRVAFQRAVWPKSTFFASSVRKVSVLMALPAS